MIEIRDYLTGELKNSDYVQEKINPWLIHPSKMKSAVDVFKFEYEMSK